MSLLVYRPPVEQPKELPVLSNRALVWGAVVLVVLGAGLAAGLLVAFGDGQHTAQLDAIRTAGTIVLGTGGAAALWLTARRQRTSELSLNQTLAAHAATVSDAEARRITDLYGKAADQLGSAQAPVRLAGLYALERLAQDNPAQRQTIVDLLCAYLRMSYEPPRREPVRRPVTRPPGVSRPLLGSAARRRASVRLAPPTPRFDTQTGTATEAEQEHQVRRTAQAILFRHLLVGTKEEPADTFWSGVSLDLTGALLGPANLIGCRITAADFTGAIFTGDVWFDRAKFGLDAVFTGVRFVGDVGFGSARFDHSALFDGVTFERFAKFNDADFSGRANFDEAEFRSGAMFIGTAFSGNASFHAVRFAGRTDFGKATFAQGGWFGDARFAESTFFRGATFVGSAGFDHARFTGARTFFNGATLARADFRAVEFGSDTAFNETRFIDDASFDLAEFTGGVEFKEAEFDDSVNFDGTRFDKFAVFDKAKFDDSARFNECQFGPSTRFEQTWFTADVSFEGTTFADGAGFVKTLFGGKARFVETNFDDVAGFFSARFNGDVTFDHVRFGGPVGFSAEFARPPRIRTVWARLDGRQLPVDSTWPPGTVVREYGVRPYGVQEGRWGQLVHASKDEA